ncbi:ABC transporter permease subunit [Gordonia sp. (in: high G+C Gram-positive bacteria)]|uniref:ABC transporter permease subunit n=1 Tax=Gordonia sp. (in: high G+C Gram-positive bacteria) TaxID=84139 RepID=UPI003C74D805
MTAVRAALRRSTPAIGLWAAVWPPVVALALLGPSIASIVGVTDPGAPVGAPYTSVGLLGTDYLGRSVAAQLLVGGRDLVLAPMAAAVLAEAAALGVSLACVWPSRWRLAVRLMMDVLLIVPPMLLVLIIVTGAGFAAWTLILLVAAVNVPFASRYLTAAGVELARSGFVETALAAGDPRWLVAARELVPNLVRPTLTDLGVRFCGAVHLVATVAFLGAATGGPSSNWATMVQRNLEGIMLNPWSVCAPAIAIVGLTIPLNMIADRWVDRR